MVNKISFKNYKLFKEKQTLELKPITILIGKNNSGKSAILKLPTLISGSLSGISQPFELINEGVKIANEYKDIVYGKGTKAFEIEIFQKKYLSDEVDFLKTEIYVNNDEPIIESWNCNNLFSLLKLDENNYQNIKINKIHETHFKGINLDSIEFKDDLFPSEEYFPLPVFNLKVDFIGALRQESKQNYQYSSNIPGKSAIDGSNLYQFLINDSLTTDKKYFNQVSNWIKDKFEGWELKIDVDGYKKEIPAIIELEKRNLKINISQTGMGISQVLPLIIRAFKPCEQETLIIVEEPESHLHPFAHAQVAQLFFETLAYDKNKKYLIETHSNNFVLRMRRLVAEGKLKPEELAIYYVDFDEDKNESSLQKIEVDEFGQVNFWPEGIFGETLQETIAIRTAQIDRK